jgi:hypothetical protein
MLDILDKAQEKGIPVPLRKIASAAGLNMDKVLEDLDYDIEVRTKIKAYQDKLKEKGLSGSPSGEEGASGDEGSDVFGAVVDDLDTLVAGLPEEKVLTASEAASVIDTLATSGMCEKPAQNRMLTG